MVAMRIRDGAAQVLDEGRQMETLTTAEAEAFSGVSCYSVDDVRAAWRYWREAGDLAGFVAYVRERIAAASATAAHGMNARIRASIASEPMRRKAA